MGPTHNNQNCLGGPKKVGSVKITTPGDKSEPMPLYLPPPHMFLCHEIHAKSNYRIWQVIINAFEKLSSNIFAG